MREKLIQFLQGQDQPCRPNEAVLSLVRRTGMTLPPEDGELEPEHGFFRDFNHGSILVPRIRHDDEVLLPEQVFPMLQEVLKPEFAPGFFIRHNGQPYRTGKGFL